MLIDEPEAMGRTAIKVSFGPSHTCCLEGWKIQAHEFMDCLTCNRTNQNPGPLIEEKKKKKEIKKRRGGPVCRNGGCRSRRRRYPFNREQLLPDSHRALADFDEIEA
jgi:hypothetical protein